MHSTRKDFIELIAYSPLIFLMFFVAALVLSRMIDLPIMQRLPSDIIGIILLVGGSALMYAADSVRREFYKPETNTTCFDFFVGPYKVSRHPGYLGLLLMYFGLALVLNSLPAFFLGFILAAIFTWIIIPREEKLITTTCDESYDDYKKRVRMWM